MQESATRGNHVNLDARQESPHSCIRCRLNCIAHLLSQIPYQEVDHETVHLPERVRNPNHLRGPIPPAMFVPPVY